MDTPRILIIEDSEATQQTLRGLFSELGCEVVTASSGEEAMERLEQKFNPDAIILDFKLPGMSGPDFYRGIAMDVRWKGIPVIPFTSQWNEQWGQDSKSALQWLITAQTHKKIYNEDIGKVISKGQQGENVSTVPKELIFAVGSALKRRGKKLSKLFEEALDLLLGP